jgi:MFS family permease
MSLLTMLGSDGRLLLAVRAVRLFGSGLVAVIIALYLAELDISTSALGLIFAAALVGSAVATVIVSAIGDRVGRCRTLMLSTVTVSPAGAVFALTDLPWLLAIAAFVGMLSPNGGEAGTSLSVEQAALAEVVQPIHRTTVFAWVNLVASAAVALGSFTAGVAGLMQGIGVELVESYRLAIWLYVLLNLSLAALFACLTRGVEPTRIEANQHRKFGLHRYRSLVVRFSLLLALNSFAAGFVAQAFVAYWFYVRFGTNPGGLGLIFFLTNLAGALSYPGAAILSKRIGLVNTMVFTHLPSNILLMLVPAMPTFLSAAVVLVLRHCLSQMDCPARDSYTMGIVSSDERTAAAWVTKVAMDGGAAAELSLAGMTAQAVAPGELFIVAETLRILYNVGLFITLRGSHTPEEKR